MTVMSQICCISDVPVVTVMSQGDGTQIWDILEIGHTADGTQSRFGTPGEMGHKDGTYRRWDTREMRLRGDGTQGRWDLGEMGHKGDAT